MGRGRELERGSPWATVMPWAERALCSQFLWSCYSGRNHYAKAVSLPHPVASYPLSAFSNPLVYFPPVAFFFFSPNTCLKPVVPKDLSESLGDSKFPIPDCSLQAQTRLTGLPGSHFSCKLLPRTWCSFKWWRLLSLCLLYLNQHSQLSSPPWVSSSRNHKRRSLLVNVVFLLLKQAQLS